MQKYKYAVQEVSAMNNYPELTAEQYREKISEVFSKVESEKILRYFYIFVFEKLARIGGAGNE